MAQGLDSSHVFLYRKLLNAYCEFRSRSWSVTTGVVEVSVSPSGYAVAELVYSYSVEGETYKGNFEKPFLIPSSADDYARSLWGMKNLLIRYRPDQPSKSFPLLETTALKSK
jgi:hypothetical protein